MEASEKLEGTHATSSPGGNFIATVMSNQLRVTHSQAPQQCADFGIRIASKDVTALRWSSDSTWVIVCSHKQIEVIDLDVQSCPMRLDNGSGGLGRFSSAEFVGSEHLLTTWEFGRAKIWDLRVSKGAELGDLKSTCDGGNWAERPGDSSALPRTLALLLRPAADDVLVLHFPYESKSGTPVKLPTVDAHSLAWSPDGRWLAVLDTPTAATSVHFYTPNGHLYRSYPAARPAHGIGFGVKHVTWSLNSLIVALSHYDGKIELLNTRTFSPLATIKHASTINQSTLGARQQAPIWQEHVSAANDRSYTLATQPVSPPLSRSKPGTEPAELGVAEACFSCDGSYLATRDERMLSTVWTWNMQTLSAHTVVIQHSNVRRMQWHPTSPRLLLLDCGEGIAHLFDGSAASAPMAVSVALPGTPTLSWLPTPLETKPAILAATKSAFRIIYPEGHDAQSYDSIESAVQPGAESYEEGASEDSILDMLSGRKPLPPLSEQSYTERVELEAEDEDGSEGDVRLNDTFQEKRRPLTNEVEVDPLDDSQIF